MAYEHMLRESTREGEECSEDCVEDRQSKSRTCDVIFIYPFFGPVGRLICGNNRPSQHEQEQIKAVVTVNNTAVEERVILNFFG